MGDSRRFDLFAKCVQRNFPPGQFGSVADIAGGKGYLQLALRECGYPKVTTFDRRKRRIRSRGCQYRHQLFDEHIEEEFDLLVAMHPDEATDVTIVEAAKRRVPFVICPCCVRPSAIVYWGNYKYHLWVAHLKREARKLGFRITETVLPMNGKSLVLIGRPIKC